MYYFWIVSSVLFWALVLWLALPHLLGANVLKKWYNRPGLFPLARLISRKFRANQYKVLSKVGLAPPVSAEFLDTLNQLKYGDLVLLRDAYRDLEKLPTVQKGMEAMGIDSIFELNVRPAHSFETPFTHGMQQPFYYVPGVPAKTFYEEEEFSEFEWFAPLVAGYDTIKSELLQLLENKGSGFQPYITEDIRVMNDWNTFNFFFFGKKFEENCAQCPKTTELLESLPNFEKDHIMFSALNPYTHIPPHFGPMNGILRVHLPLIVPDGCYLKVGADVRKVEEGKIMVFDDSFLHEAWNHSRHLRIVLFLNFWHPCFAKEEIPVLEAFRAAYEAHPIAKRHAKGQEEKRETNLVMAK